MHGKKFARRLIPVPRNNASVTMGRRMNFLSYRFLRVGLTKSCIRHSLVRVPRRAFCVSQDARLGTRTKRQANVEFTRVNLAANTLSR